MENSPFPSMLPAQADAAHNSTTRAVLKLMDHAGLHYTLIAVNAEGDEVVNVFCDDGDGYPCPVLLFFDTCDKRCRLRVWDVITFDADHRAEVLNVCNKLNNEYLFLRFSVNDDDNSVTAATDMVLRVAAGPRVLEAMLYTFSTIRAIRPALLPYKK